MTTVDPEILGKAYRVEDAAGRYVEFAKSTVPLSMNLNGLKVVVDTAHGATYHTTPLVFSELGAEVIHIGGKPDGLNINDSVGSTDITLMRETCSRKMQILGLQWMEMVIA